LDTVSRQIFGDIQETQFSGSRIEFHVHLKNAFPGGIGNRRTVWLQSLVCLPPFGYNLWFASHPSIGYFLYHRGHFNFFTHTDEGVGGCQTSEAGSFPDTNREVLGGTEIHLFEFGVKYLNFGATYLSFGAICLNLGAIYLGPYI